MFPQYVQSAAGAWIHARFERRSLKGKGNLSGRRRDDGRGVAMAEPRARRRAAPDRNA
jgi:hypothetical protein